MADLWKNDPQYQNVDDVLQKWRQEDCMLGEERFVHRFDHELPLTEESATVAGEDVNIIESEVRGLVVLTQTCDIVRQCVERPFIEVAPIVEVTELVAHEIERGRRPVYAVIPALRHLRLVADLDRTMTVEKSVVAKWTRTEGCRTDDEMRRFSLALTRKRARFAFPDDFTELVAKLQSRLLEKHDRQSDEGHALRALREIRVRAAPSWSAPEVELIFWFIREEDDIDFRGTGWESWCEVWLQLIPSSGRFRQVEGFVAALEDLTAKDYVESDPLDLDYLSTRRG
jgi:hypothetical protein